MNQRIGQEVPRRRGHASRTGQTRTEQQIFAGTRGTGAEFYG
ncbi:hypothetical protein BPORC_1744 [Bifidobacterium porcinum]|nr:hypothetical protein BPORC_1744 [Bifidobacterium porcinum]